jgi:Cd2+/Zn2+-exporting ATPase
MGNGALVGGNTSEAMAQIKAIALDKTRTITYGTQSFPMFSAKRNQLPKLLACTAGTELF